MPHTISRIIAFKNAFARRQAQRVIDVDGGFAVLHHQFAASYNHNKLVLAEVSDPADAMSVADRVLGEADLSHRMVVVNDDETGLAATASFGDAGYEHEAVLVMRHGGAEPDRPAGPSVRVEPVPWAALQDVDRRTWRSQLPGASEQAIEQLVGRRAATLLGADEVTFLAVRDDAGGVVSHADLYLDRANGVAQIEEVATVPGHRGRGYARELLAEGLRRAIAANCGVLFLEADAGDWPRHLYARLGYRTIGRNHTFTRADSDPR